MNAILPRSTHTIQTSVLAVWRAQPGALMILGRASGSLPKTGSARMAAGTGALGVFRAEFWSNPNSQDHIFLAVVRMPDRANPADDAELALRGARTSDRDFRLRLIASYRETEFGQEVAALAGAHAAALARFMLDVMRPDDNSDMRRPHTLLVAFLGHAARRDGCIELMLHAPDHCVVMQGWGTRPTAPVELISTRSGLQRHAVEFAEFKRDDVPAPATGTVLVLAPDALSGVAGAEMVFLLTGDHLLCRPVVEQRVLDRDASIGQIRHLLPRLDGPPALCAQLRAALQPQFGGTDTLNTSPRPVRAAIDIAVEGGTAGAFISGWLFDPTGQVVDVSYSSDTMSVRLDDSFVRVRREDVSAAFHADRAFPAPLNHDAGFAASIEADPRAGQKPHLRFTFADGDRAFLPFTLVPVSSGPIRQRLLQTIDLHKPSGIQIVERHLAPFMSRLATAARRAGLALLEGPLDRTRALIVPLRSTALPRSLIASFLHDPAKADEQVIFICGPEWDYAETDALLELVDFYALPATIITVAESIDPTSAVLEAAVWCGAETLLVISPTTVGQSPGWREALWQTSPEAAAVCPTVLYEDRSIRFAGSTEIDSSPRAPFARLRVPLAGLPATYAAGVEPIPTKGGTLSCCLLRRKAIPALERAARFLTAPGQEAAFFMELAEAGLSATWAPLVKVVAPDEETFSVSVSSLVDGWMLRKAWRH